MGQGAPVDGEGVGGPRDAGEEEQDDGHEDEEHHAGLTGAHEAGENHGKEDAGQKVRQEEEQRVPGVTNGGVGEDAWDDDERPEADGDVDNDVSEGLAKEDAEGAAEASVEGDEVVEAALLAGGAAQHADTQDERLLDDKDQNGGQEEAGETVGGVEEGHRFVGNGRDVDLLKLVGGLRRAGGTDLAPHVERDFGGGQEKGFVVQQQAHVGIKRDGGLTPSGKIAVEVGREEEDAVGLLAIN